MRRSVISDAFYPSCTFVYKKHALSLKENAKPSPRNVLYMYEWLVWHLGIHRYFSRSLSFSLLSNSRPWTRAAKGNVVVVRKSGSSSSGISALLACAQSARELGQYPGCHVDAWCPFVRRRARLHFTPLEQRNMKWKFQTKLFTFSQLFLNAFVTFTWRCQVCESSCRVILGFASTKIGECIMLYILGENFSIATKTQRNKIIDR